MTKEFQEKIVRAISTICITIMIITVTAMTVSFGIAVIKTCLNA